MKKTGAWLTRYALEQLNIRHTFGIPGVHNTEIYDELNNSDSIKPMLVTHEGGGSFMADAISRTSDDTGTLMVVPAAGITHAASGIGEAFLDGVAMLVISGGIRTDGMRYQLHDIDQHALLAPITKATFKVTEHKDVVETLYKAYDIANSGEPGPVFVEIPINIALFKGEVASLPKYSQDADMYAPKPLDDDAIQAAADALLKAKNPGLFVGWGARFASQELQELAEWLNAPVATTLQGLSVFPANHPLHVGMGFGSYAVPAATEAFNHCDAMLAVATRFSEIPTGSFGVTVPEQLVHVDINPDVFSANYPASVTIESDAKLAVAALLEVVKERLGVPRSFKALANRISKDKQSYQKEWFKHNTKGRVNPAKLFSVVRQELADDDFVVCDDGNHTFLSAELMPIHKAGHFISPTDFNAMGYCVPAAIGTKLANPDKQVFGIVGDGAFMMTCMELITAVKSNLGMVITVFNDGELAQIAQAQTVPYNRKTCTMLSGLNVEGVAMATGSEYLAVDDNEQLAGTFNRAFKMAQNNQVVIVDVKIDYSKSTRFTKGIVKTNLGRFDLSEKVRFISRGVKRRLMG